MDSCTVLTIDDLREALLRGVDLKDIETTVLRHLNLPSPECTASSSLFLLRDVSPDLAGMLSQLLEGSYPEGIKPGALRKAFHIPFSPRGGFVSDYLQSHIEKIKPAVVVVDAPPAEVDAGLHYACSLCYGLKVSIDVSYIEEKHVREQMRFLPGDFIPELAVYCLQNRIPLVPLGTPPRIVTPEHRSGYSQLLQELYDRFVHKDQSGMSLEGLERLSRSLMQQLSSTGPSFAAEREELIHQSCYLVSRMFDLARYLSATNYKDGPVLAFYRIEHSLDFPELSKAFWQDPATVAELYNPLENQSVRTYRIRVNDSSGGTVFEHSPSRHAERMESALKQLLSDRMHEEVELAEIDRMSSAIALALRSHPLIERPPGVRGTLATREIAQGYGIIRGKITRQTLAQAACLAFRHRTSLQQGRDATIEAVLKGVFSRLLYGVPLYPAEDEAREERRRPLTPEELSQALMGLSDAAFRALTPDECLPVDGPVFAEQAMQHPLVQQALQDAMEKGLLEDLHAGYQDLLDEIEDRGYLDQLDSSRLTLSRDGEERLRESLEEGLERGELSPEELAEKLAHARSLPAPQGLDGDKLFLSPQAETELIAEIMDFQHQGRSERSSLEDLYVQYTLDEKKGIEVSSEKLDYEKLKILIRQMEKKGLVNIAGERKRFTLSHRSLEKLLEGLVRRQETQVLEKRAFRREHETDKTEVRRFKRGDVFRDLSTRHTLRRIIRKAKSLEEINHSDLRSFEKKPSNQVDIAVCVDISASMKESSKLRYAKMTVAELAKAAIAKHDRVGVVAFSNLGEVVVPLTDKITPLLEATMTLRAEQYTNIGNGLRCARQMLLRDRNTNPKYIILITDGQPNAALSDDYGGDSYHEQVAAFSRQTTMETKKAMGTHHALVEAGKTSRKHIKISVVYVCPEESDNEESERTVREIARLGSGRFHKVKAIERLPLEALATVG